MRKTVTIDISDADEESAMQAAFALIGAYRNGEERGGSIEIDEIVTAIDLANKAIPGAREMVATALSDADVDDIELAPNALASPAMLACLRLIHADRNKDSGFAWEEVDFAHEAALEAAQANGLRP